MTIQTTGAPKRRTLSLHFGGRKAHTGHASERGNSLLSEIELRGLVAAMID